MKVLILLRDIYSIISLTDNESFDLTEGIFTVYSYVLIPVVLMRDIYSIIVCIDTSDLTEGYLQYHCMYWYLWSYWGIFTVPLYVLIPDLMRDIYSIIVCIDTFDLTEGYLQYHQYWYLTEGYLQYHCIIAIDLTEGYLQYHQPDW